MDSNDDLADFEIVYENVTKDERLTCVTRQLAKRLTSSPYLTLGDFFQSLSNEDLDVLMSLVEQADFENDSPTEQNFDAASEVLLLTEMLVRAEGVDRSNHKDIMERCYAFAVIAAGCALGRKGLVKVYYENMSFGSEYSDKKLFKLIDSGQE